MIKNIIKRVAKDLSVSERSAGPIVGAVLEAMKNEIAENEKISLRGFGSFSKKRVRNRKIRAIKTGEVKSVSFFRIIFKPSLDLRNKAQR